MGARHRVRPAAEMSRMVFSFEVVRGRMPGVKLLTDDDVRATVTPQLARTAMRDAVVAAYQGRLVAPPRVVAGLADRRLTFTCGSVEGEWYGYRSYTAPGSMNEDQVVVVHDAGTGEVAGLAVGTALGPRRVGAIGAVALDALAPSSPTGLAVIGTGQQAWHQLWALPDRVKGLPVRVYSPTLAHRHDFAARARTMLNLDVEDAPSVSATIDGANIIIVATSSPSPVIGPDDIPDGAYMTTLGPKQVGRAEIGPDLTRDAALVVTDSLAQLRAYDPPHVLAAADHGTHVAHLGAILTGTEHPTAGTRIFLSTGLAGTEAWRLNAALQVGE